MLKSTVFGTLALLTLLMQPAFAYPIPDRPIRLIVPFAAGGSTDIMAREIGRRLSLRLGVTIIVENKPGGSTTVGAVEVARAAPDGHTLLYTSMVTFTLNPHLLKPKGYNVERDFTPIAGLTTTNIVLLGGNHIEATNLKEFVAVARRAQGKMTVGNIGVGTAAHLFGVHLSKTLGVELVHVPYRGSAPASNDFLGGQIDALFDPVPAAVPKLESNRGRAIGIAAKVRNPLLPNVPTFDEQGLSGVDKEIWIGLFAPARLPEDVSCRLGEEVSSILKDPQLQEIIARNGEQPLILHGKEFVDFVDRSRQSWGDLIGQLGVKLED